MVVDNNSQEIYVFSCNELRKSTNEFNKDNLVFFISIILLLSVYLSFWSPILWYLRKFFFLF